MPRPKVPSRPRIWPRVAVLALVGVAVAGCENSARFDSNPFASSRRAPPQYTGSVAPPRSAAGRRVVAQPLPAPSRPETVAAGGASSGGHGFAAYRPSARAPEVTGSVPAHRAPPPKRAGHWTWDGGQAVTVARGDTLASIARRHGVPVAALMQTNNIHNPSALRPGQRLVIPRYVHDSASAVRPAPNLAPMPALKPAAKPRRRAAADNVHVVAPGETLMGISRRSGVSLSALARANHIAPYTRVKIGDRIVIPGGGKLAARVPAPAPQAVPPRTTRPERKVASVTTQSARMVKPEVRQTESVTRKAEPAGGIPSFRWPVRGRIIAAFGRKPNGTQNDGINLAVPEGTPIKAADDGVVAYAGNELKGYGNLVLIRHSGGYVSAYANASKLLVKRGDTVKRGQVIANAGQTGNVTSPQLHFEIRKGSTPVNPQKFLHGA
jgi:murein DD-endopeptidase MepM/ murein hydrolase activator NlpD